MNVTTSVISTPYTPSAILKRGDSVFKPTTGTPNNCANHTLYCIEPILPLDGSDGNMREDSASSLRIIGRFQFLSKLTKVFETECLHKFIQCQDWTAFCAPFSIQITTICEYYQKQNVIPFSEINITPLLESFSALLNVNEYFEKL